MNYVFILNAILNPIIDILDVQGLVKRARLYFEWRKDKYESMV
jgi:hypothetical protein